MTISLRERGSRAIRSGAPARAVLGAPGIAILALFAVAPMVALLVTAFRTDAGEVSFDNLAKVLGSATYLELLARTIGVALLVTVVSIAIGWPAAWALARHTPARLRMLVLSLAIIPYITSQILLIYAFMTL